MSTKGKGLQKNSNMQVALDTGKKYLATMAASAISVYQGYAQMLGLIETTETGPVVRENNIFGLFVCVIVIILTSAIFLHCIWAFVVEYRKQRGKTFNENDKQGIGTYLTDFIKSGESVAILTHDMSWITEENKSILEDQARKKALLLFLPEPTDTVNELVKLGADARYYGKILSDPANPLVKSRMTVINWNKAFPKLTYPIRKNGFHINNEIDSGDPANLLALDLLQLLLYISDKGVDAGELDGQDVQREAQPRAGAKDGQGQ